MVFDAQHVAVYIVSGLLGLILLFYAFVRIYGDDIKDNVKTSKEKIDELNRRLKIIKETINKFELDDDASAPEIKAAERILYWCSSAADDMVKLNILKVNKSLWKKNDIPLPPKILKKYIKDISLDY